MSDRVEAEGVLSVDPPLNAAERRFLQRFHDTCHCQRKGEFDLDPAGSGCPDPHLGGQYPVRDQPYSNCCPWTCSDDGTMLFLGYGGTGDYPQWLEYLIEAFLVGNSRTRANALFAGFGFDHTVDGTVELDADLAGRSRITVEANTVSEDILDDDEGEDDDWA